MSGVISLDRGAAVTRFLLKLYIYPHHNMTNRSGAKQHCLVGIKTRQPKATMSKKRSKQRAAENRAKIKAANELAQC